jgi:uncharacterized membrane protein YdbT with pleckstrin-like domain
MTQEETVWRGNPSQVINLGTFIGWGLLVWLIFPLFIILWKWLEVKHTQYEITSQRLRTRSGILNKKTDDLELYRVKDYRLDQPFFLRIFSLGNLVLETSDKSHPLVVLKAIPHAEQVKEKLRAQVEVLRDKKRVREMDFE